MRRRNKLILAIVVVILIGAGTFVADIFYMAQNAELAQGHKTILVCGIDESEERPGMGACDMAFLVTLDNGTLENYTAIYPGGMSHPTASEPEAVQAQGAGPRLLLHDSFWDNDTHQSMEYAKEIVEYNLNLSSPIDAVIAINTEALNAILKSAGPVTVNGEKVNVSGIDIIREEQYGEGMSRGDAVMDLAKGIADASENPTIKTAMIESAINQYAKGNIVMEPQNEFMALLASKGLENLFS